MRSSSSRPNIYMMIALLLLVLAGVGATMGSSSDVVSSPPPTAIVNFGGFKRSCLTALGNKSDVVSLVMIRPCAATSDDRQLWTFDQVQGFGNICSVSHGACLRIPQQQKYGFSALSWGNGLGPMVLLTNSLEPIYSEPLDFVFHKSGSLYVKGNCSLILDSTGHTGLPSYLWFGLPNPGASENDCKHPDQCQQWEFQ